MNDEFKKDAPNTQKQDKSKDKDGKDKKEKGRRNSTAPIREQDVALIQTNFLKVERRKSQNPAAESLPTIGELVSQSNIVSSYNLLDRESHSLVEPSIVNLQKIEQLRESEKEPKEKKDTSKSPSQSISIVKSSMPSNTFSDVSQDNVIRREDAQKPFIHTKKLNILDQKELLSPAVGSSRAVLSGKNISLSRDL